jgi:hypothetical protein
MIETHAHAAAEQIQHKQSDEWIVYPPNGGLTAEEKQGMDQLPVDEYLKSALRKIIASNIAEVFFDLFNLLDGTSDPEVHSENWSGMSLVDFSEEQESNEMLHDDLFDTYWAWKAERKSSDWKLDLLED